MEGASNNLHTTAVVPVKGLDDANRRLNAVLPAKERYRLAEALFLDLIVKLPHLTVALLEITRSRLG